MSGWVKLHRKLTEKPIWKESTPEQKVVLITILTMAQHTENEWEWMGESYRTMPGQFISSLPKIAEKCGKGVTIQNVRTALKRFEKYEFLTDQSTNRNRLITVVNWEHYQGQDDEDNRVTNRQLTGNQQAPNRHLTANKNDKNDKKEKNKDILLDFVDDWFDAFWSVYPRKVSKPKALKSFKVKVKNKETFDLIMSDLEKRKFSKQWQEKQYIPHPTTYLTQERWLDEYEPQAPRSSKVIHDTGYKPIEPSDQSLAEIKSALAEFYPEDKNLKE